MTPRILIPLFVAALAVSGCSSSNGEGERPTLRERIDQAGRTHVVVIITVRDRVKVDGERVDPDELPAKFAELAKRNPGRPVALLLEPGSKPEAETFVRKHAAKAGLGAVELISPE